MSTEPIESQPAAPEWDVLIRGGLLYDGSGAAARRADVALRGDRIAAVGALHGRAGRNVEADGLAVAPGFIDVHSHDDFAVLLDPEMDFKLLQGVTTDVVGNCGMGAAPYRPAARFAQVLHPGAELPSWEGYAGYLEAIDRDPPSLNVAVLVGHGTLRTEALRDPRGAADADELERMRAILREGLESGAFGFSTGLIYDPGRYAPTSELIDLAREMERIGGIYATHMRDEGTGLVDSVTEALRIGSEGGVPVQISHHKAAGREAWGLVSRSLALLEDARQNGRDVTADQYPYTAGSTILAAVVENAEARGLGAGAEDVVVASCPAQPGYEGRSLAELAAVWGLEPRAAARRVLDEEPATWVVMHSMHEDDVRQVLRHPTTMIGSDGIPTRSGKPHPRLYGTFARVLGRYVREEKLLSLEEGIHRMTGMPASKFGLTDRGMVREGAFADLVVFDPARIDDVATYTEPRRHPPGIHHVFVNGSAVVRDGAHTRARPGRALRRGASKAGATARPARG